MKLSHAFLAGTCLTIAVPITVAAPTVFPTGTTIYKPEEAWNGFTVLSILDTPAVIVIDMNGRVVKRWEGFNVSAGGPARIFPDGSVIAPSGVHPPHQESVELVQKDFEGNVTWSFRRNEQIKDEQGTTVWSSRQHHDWQRPDFPAGYYSPDATPDASAEAGNTLLLTHTTLRQPAVADVELEDDRLIEISPTGELLWEWNASDHIDEFQFDAAARTAIASPPGDAGARGYDWLHINSAHYVGPNPWFAAGDQRFAPDNVIISSRQASVIAIIARDGSVVWQLGPDFSRSKEQQAIGQIIGQHHAHFIPPGLPGAGNVLIYDNGGSSGYGAPSPIAPTGVGIYARATSRVLEINPVTLERVWMYTAPNFFSTNISSAQRLANGNTLITEGAPGRIFEVTSAGAIVWEYMNAPGETGRKSNSVYRAYRVPYSWIPQLGIPQQTPVTAPPPGEFVIGL
jgi:hypothetical protein